MRLKGNLKKIRTNILGFMLLFLGVSSVKAEVEPLGELLSDIHIKHLIISTELRVRTNDKQELEEKFSGKLKDFFSQTKEIYFLNSLETISVVSHVEVEKEKFENLQTSQKGPSLLIFVLFTPSENGPGVGMIRVKIINDVSSSQAFEGQFFFKKPPINCYPTEINSIKGGSGSNCNFKEWFFVVGKALKFDMEAKSKVLNEIAEQQPSELNDKEKHKGPTSVHLNLIYWPPREEDCLTWEISETLKGLIQDNLLKDGLDNVVKNKTSKDNCTKVPEQLVTRENVRDRALDEARGYLSLRIKVSTISNNLSEIEFYFTPYQPKTTLSPFNSEHPIPNSSCSDPTAGANQIFCTFIPLYPKMKDFLKKLEAPKKNLNVEN